MVKTCDEEMLIAILRFGGKPFRFRCPRRAGVGDLSTRIGKYSGHGKQFHAVELWNLAGWYQFDGPRTRRASSAETT